MQFKYYLSILGFFTFAHLLGATPTISALQYPNSAPKFEKFELDFQLPAYHNPYDFEEIDVWAEFTSPKGIVFRINGFYFEEFQKVDNGAPQSDEILMPTLIHSWKVRFAANEVGTWTFRLHARDQSGATVVPDVGAASFFVTESDNKGFISKANSHYLKFDNGDPYYPIGDSYPFWICSPYRASSNGKEKGTNIMRHYLQGMHENGINYNRFELNLYEGLSLTGRDFVLQKTYHHYYNQHDAWQLDRILDDAQDMGVYFNLALFPGGDLVDHGHFQYLEPETNTYYSIPDTNSQGIPVTGFAFGCWSLYNSFNKYQDPRYRPTWPDSVGPCANRFEYFSHPKAILDQKKLNRYVVSRWGFHTSVMGWELLDEMSASGPVNGNDLIPHYVPTPIDELDIYSQWVQETSDYIHTIDPYQHLISVGLGDPGNVELTYKIVTQTDFMNFHWYQGYGPSDDPSVTRPTEYYFADAIRGWTSIYDKPLAILETNWLADGYTRDPHYYELHNLLWSNLFNGSMGLIAVWAHEEAILGHQAINQFIGVSKYSKQLPMLSADYASIFKSDKGLKWEYLANYREDRFYGWVQDENLTFYALWTGPNIRYLDTWNRSDRPAQPEALDAYKLPINRRGNYRIQWYHTETGMLYATEYVATQGDSLPVQVPLALRNSTWADAGFSIEFVEGEPALLVFPNPSQDVFQVILKQESDAETEYQVYSALGQLLRKGVIAKGQTEFSLDLSALSAGNYLLTTMQGNRRQTKILTRY